MERSSSESPGKMSSSNVGVECECGRVLEKGSPTLRVKGCKYCSGWIDVDYGPLDLGIDYDTYTRNLIVILSEERLNLSSIDNIEL